MAGISPAQTEHDRLREFRQSLVSAVENRDIDAISAKLHPQVIVTWQNGEVCRGKEELRAFYEKMAAGSGNQFEGYKVPPTPDVETTLYANGTVGVVGVVAGHHVGQFRLMGWSFDMPNRWTATLVQENGEWLLAAYQVSMNVLDNPLLNAVKKVAIAVAILALLIGLGAGVWIGKRRTAAQQP